MKEKNKKILITGSSGMIGTRLFEKLLEKKFDVLGFDKRINKWHKNLNALTIIGDLLNKGDLEKIPKNIDLVIHLAANAGVCDSVKDPDLSKDNIAITHNVLEFARKNGINKIIFPSSREVYGDRNDAKSKEKDVDLERCQSPYSAGKIADEASIYAYSKCFGLEYIVLRFSNVYGMYDESQRFVPLMIRKIKNNEDIKIFGKDKVLDLIYIDDCVDGIIKCVEKFDNVKNNIFNIANGKSGKLINTVETIKKNLNSKSKIKIGKNRIGEVIGYKADISKAKKILKYNPKYSVKEGIKLAVGWYNKN